MAKTGGSKDVDYEINKSLDELVSEDMSLRRGGAAGHPSGGSHFSGGGGSKGYQGHYGSTSSRYHNQR